MGDDEDVPPGVDASRPSPARLYDCFLGGANCLEVDRDAVRRFAQRLPDPDDLMDATFANRGFHGRSARWIAEQGVRQFIDIGCGLPTQNNTHEAVQKIVPGASVVYVDKDPAVAAMAGELLTPEGTTRFVQADLREPDALLASRDLRELIDFSEPTGLLMTSVLHFVADSSHPRALVERYLDAVPPGSYLSLSHATADRLSPRVVDAVRDLYALTTDPIYYRTEAEVTALFDGLELVPPYGGARPALTYLGVWGCEDLTDADTEGSRWGYCGVGVKPSVP